MTVIVYTVHNKEEPLPGYHCSGIYQIVIIHLNLFKYIFMYLIDTISVDNENNQGDD